MSFNVGFIKADTHTPEYLMHKYWARKPHNVISECISALTNIGDTVIDPFCGSGVAIREGALLGRNCYGFDLNPSAFLISSVLLNPPHTSEFVETFNNIYNDAYKKFGNLYVTEDGYTIKYLSHKTIAKCDCGKILKQSECISKNKKLLCPNCGATVRFNLERLVDTEVSDIIVENNNQYVPTEVELNKQKELSTFFDDTVNASAFNYEFPENRRILAFNGITTSSFFTKRNFCILSYFANCFWKIENKKIRDCALLLLTASSAQCSRLIASRNKLSTGGPAWSVPGFWVPQEHLETNPFVHFKARLSKFKKALECLEKNPVTGIAKIMQGNSFELLESREFANLKADLIFLDPPYGDSVPYTEFSNIWNSFLKAIPCSDDDISVSDRIEKNKSWENYRIMLDNYMRCFTNHLTEKGKLLITFNNNDMRAWKSLLAALQKNGFICMSVFYQIPAVISAKAQMSLNSSYISDVYSVYTFSPNTQIMKDLSPILSHLCFVANSREGRLTKTVLDREFILSWMKNNIDYNLLDNKDSIIDSLFYYDKLRKLYFLKENYVKETKQLKDVVIAETLKLIKNGSCTLLESYIKINALCEEYGTIDFGEFKSYISNFAIENENVYGCTQLSFFD